MRNHFADTFYQLAKDDPNLCLVVADISPAGSVQKFREEFPDRFINTGVAEQAMIGIAAGMALRGFRVFAYTIATFALYRPFEFIRNDLAYQGLPVTVIGIGGGLTYSSLGPTHHAMEDVAVACSVPELQVIAPCDPLETEAAVRWCATESRKPTYIRLGKAGEPVLTGLLRNQWEFGTVRYLQYSPGDICIVTYGTIASVAKEVAQRLGSFGPTGRKVSILNVSTLAPLDRHGLEQMLAEHKNIVVIEEAPIYTGLSMQIPLLSSGRHRLHAFGLSGQFCHKYGTHVELLEGYGLTADQIVARLRGHI